MVLCVRTQRFCFCNLNGRNWRGKLVERNLGFCYDSVRRCGKLLPQIHQKRYIPLLFHEKLIQRRKEKGMAQEDLAEQLYVSRQTVSKWENGECMPDADKFIRLSDILEISLDELAGRKVEAESVVDPTPKLPKPGKKLFHILAAVAVCLLFALGGFILGRYVFPETQHAAVVLPETLTSSGFAMAGGNASFTANAAIDGEVYLYRSDLLDSKPISLPAVYENGVYTVANIPAGQYDKMVLVISANGLERSALVVTHLEIHADGSASWWDE